MRFLLSLAAVLLVADLSAQLPRGGAVYCKLWNPVQPAVFGGLEVFHPVHGTFLTVTGLPAILTGPPNPLLTFGVGALSVLVRDSDGMLFVGPRVWNNPLDIYQIQLAGTVAATVTPIPIGALTGGGALIDQMAWLPNGDLLFTHRGPIVGFPATGIAILNPATGAVASVPFAPVPANYSINAVAVDAAGTTAYVGMFGTSGTPNAGTSQIFTVPLPGGGVPSPLLAAPLVGNINQLQWDCAARLWASLQGTGTSANLVLVNAPGGPVGQLVLPGLNGMAVDNISGNILLATELQPAASAMWNWNIGTGILTPVPGMSGTDTPSGIAIRASMATYGTALPTAPQSTQWQLCPNPGGAPVIPLVGVTPFSVTLTVSPNTTLGLMAFSPLPWPGVPLPGPPPIQNVLVSPAQLFPFFPLLLPTGTPTTWTVPLPIPAGLQPMPLYAQAFHLNLAMTTWFGGQGLEFRLH